MHDLDALFQRGRAAMILIAFAVLLAACAAPTAPATLLLSTVAPAPTAIPSSPAAPTALPTALPSPTPAPPAATLTPPPTAAPTASPTPPPTPTEALKATVPVVKKEVPLTESESRFFTPDVNHTFEVVVGGVSVKITFGLMSGITTSWSREAIKDFYEGKLGGVAMMAEAWLRFCHANHLKYGGTALAFEDYLKLVAAGKGDIRIPIADESKVTNKNVREWGTLKPNRVTAILTAGNEGLPVVATQNLRWYLGKSSEGGLVVVFNGLTEDWLIEQAKYAPSQDKLPDYKGAALTSMLLVALSVPAVPASSDEVFLAGQKTTTEFDLGATAVSIRRIYTDDMAKDLTPYLRIVQ